MIMITVLVLLILMIMIMIMIMMMMMINNRFMLYNAFSIRISSNAFYSHLQNRQLREDAKV